MSSVVPRSHAVARAPIRALNRTHQSAIADHLLALGEHDRYLRFGYAARDEHIRRYVDGLRFDCDEVFGIFNRRMKLVAMAHLGYMVESAGVQAAEFGVSVSAHARGRGYGNQLFERAVVHARNQGVTRLLIHALSENTVMLNIARKGGAHVVRSGSESEAHLELPPTDFGTHMAELLDEQLARTDYHVKAHTRQLRAGSRWLWRGLSGLWRRVRPV